MMVWMHATTREHVRIDNQSIMTGLEAYGTNTTRIHLKVGQSQMSAYNLLERQILRSRNRRQVSASCIWVWSNLVNGKWPSASLLTWYQQRLTDQPSGSKLDIRTLWRSPLRGRLYRLLRIGLCWKYRSRFARARRRRSGLRAGSPRSSRSI